MRVAPALVCAPQPYEGFYGRVAAFVREWKAGRQRVQQATGRGVFVPLVFQPGEAFQFGWSEE